MQLKDLLYIHSNAVGNTKDNILETVPGSGSDFSTLRYTCFDVEARAKKLTNKTTSYHFEVLDDDGNPVNLSLNILMTLMFFKKNDNAEVLDPMIIEGIKLFTMSAMKYLGITLPNKNLK
jgi:hypothetical protein